MEIRNTGNPEVRREGVGSTGNAEGAAAGAKGARAGGSSAEGADRVTFTDAAQSLLKQHSEGTVEAPVDRDRVNSIRQSLEDGTYEVRPERIAAKLVRQDNG